MNDLHAPAKASGRSDSQEKFSAIEGPQKHEDHEDEKDSEGERGVHRAEMRNEKSIVEPSVQRGLVAMEFKELKIGADFRDERREGVRQDRIHAEH